MSAYHVSVKYGELSTKFQCVIITEYGGYMVKFLLRIVRVDSYDLMIFLIFYLMFFFIIIRVPTEVDAVAGASRAAMLPLG